MNNSYFNIIDTEHYIFKAARGSSKHLNYYEHILLKEESSILSPTLSRYFKEVFVSPGIKYLMKESKRKMGLI